MGIRAVVVDIGGVLERVEPPEALAATWQRRLGLDPAELRAALGRVDPDGVIGTGGLAEAEYQRRYADALGLTPAQSAQFMRDMWDWYCGELDTELTGYLASLRPRYLTAILSNSADGARREEQARYGFADLVDTIIYSHEVGLAKPDPRVFALTCERLRVAADEAVFLDDVPAFVAAARAFGMHAVRHESTPASIAAIDALLAG
ncbi:MAG TPA: HAD-IA family hydrolase [Mycobacteriales bacterium]|nr:HAD-IA family hydrolase [Mycobacteriales bacterium]